MPKNRSWRPFQLAFILLNLPALTDPTTRACRRVTALADLLWFPTGGGKTEAYLGLTALRARHPAPAGRPGRFDARAGVAVLMRYTLRLLTIQQFQRAAALICACEVIRRADAAAWGEVPFRIGLWVGARVTPNRTDDAEDWLKQQRGGKRTPSRALGSPHQLTSCPWCGTRAPARPGHQGRHWSSRRTLVTCPDSVLRVRPGAQPGEGTPGRGRRRGDLPPAAQPDHRHGGQVRADAVAGRDAGAVRPGRAALRPARLRHRDTDGRASGSCTPIPPAPGQERRRCRPDRAGHAAPPAGPDHPGRAAPDLRAARVAGRAVRDGRRPALPPGRSRRHGQVGPRPEGDRLHGHDPSRAETDRRALRPADRGLPAAGLDIGDNFFARQRPTARATPGRRYVGICAHGAG